MQSLATYLKEIGYALRSGRNWRSRAALLATTARFHLHNARNRPPLERRPIDLDLDIGGTTRTISVRPLSGDIFILYEVLAFEAYWLPDEHIHPAAVRTIIDCGANIGLTALYFASRYPNARILCIEPDPANFELLCKNVADEPRIEPLRAALVGRPRTSVAFSQDRPAWGNSVSDEPGRGAALDVPATTIDQLRERFALGSIDILKVDIEGAEEEVFRQTAFLSSVRFIVIELHGDYTIDRFKRDIGPMGFDVRLPGSPGGSRALTAFPASDRVMAE